MIAFGIDDFQIHIEIGSCSLHESRHRQPERTGRVIPVGYAWIDEGDLDSPAFLGNNGISPLFGWKTRQQRQGLAASAGYCNHDRDNYGEKANYNLPHTIMHSSPRIEIPFEKYFLA
jgi:hypothetical protein